MKPCACWHSKHMLPSEGTGVSVTEGNSGYKRDRWLPGGGRNVCQTTYIIDPVGVFLLSALNPHFHNVTLKTC